MSLSNGEEARFVGCHGQATLGGRRPCESVSRIRAFPSFYLLIARSKLAGSASDIRVGWASLAIHAGCGGVAGGIGSLALSPRRTSAIGPCFAPSNWVARAGTRNGCCATLESRAATVGGLIWTGGRGSAALEAGLPGFERCLATRGAGSGTLDAGAMALELRCGLAD